MKCNSDRNKLTENRGREREGRERERGNCKRDGGGGMLQAFDKQRQLSNGTITGDKLVE